MNPSQNAIYMAFDDNHGEYARVCLKSIRKNYPGHPPVLVEYTGNDSRLTDFIDGLQSVERVALAPTDAAFSELPASENYPPIIYRAFNAFGEHFDAYDKLLFLDADTLVRKPLDDLFAQEDFFIVRDGHLSGNQRVFSDPANPALAELLTERQQRDLGEASAYANSGVFLVPRKNRSLEIYRELCALAATFAAHIVHTPDQSAISLWCYLNGIEVSSDNRFNYQTAHLVNDALRLNLDDVLIYHYSGPKIGSPMWRNMMEVAGTILAVSGEYEEFLAS